MELGYPFSVPIQLSSLPSGNRPRQATLRAAIAYCLWVGPPVILPLGVLLNNGVQCHIYRLYEY